MKRLTFILFALLAIAGRVSAQESVSVNSITVPQGGEAFLNISYSLEGAGPYVGFMFLVNLPDGLSLVEDEAVPGSLWYDSDVAAISQMNITAMGNGVAALPKVAASSVSGSGILMRLRVAASSSLAVGKTLKGSLTEVSFNVRDEGFNVTKVSVPDASFNVTIGEPGSVVLDENSSDPIMAGWYDKLTLKRSFAAGWNTLCLPFDIDDIYGFFGMNVVAYKFNKYNTTSGELEFTVASTISARTPYVVYVPAAITSDFVLTDLDIEDSNTKSSYVAKSGVYFRGTYVPIAPDGWTKRTDTDVIYGVTTDGYIAKAGADASIKGFRAYFDMPAGAEVKGLVFEEDPTGLITLPQGGDDGQTPIYNLAGQRLSKMREGVNITNGKKVLK